jgi:hypothetical protein
MYVCSLYVLLKKLLGRDQCGVQYFDCHLPVNMSSLIRKVLFHTCYRRKVTIRAVAAGFDFHDA